MADPPHHREVVRDEQVGEPELLLERLEQLEDPRLHRDVEGGHGLVEHDDVGAMASARAIATRWRWPPDSSRGERCEHVGGQRDAVDQLGGARRGARARVPSPKLCSGSAMICSTLWRGSSDENGFW